MLSSLVCVSWGVRVLRVGVSGAQRSPSSPPTHRGVARRALGGVHSGQPRGRERLAAQRDVDARLEGGRGTSHAQ